MGGHYNNNNNNNEVNIGSLRPNELFLCSRACKSKPNNLLACPKPEGLWIYLINPTKQPLTKVTKQSLLLPSEASGGHLDHEVWASGQGAYATSSIYCDRNRKALKSLKHESCKGCKTNALSLIQPHSWNFKTEPGKFLDVSKVAACCILLHSKKVTPNSFRGGCHNGTRKSRATEPVNMTKPGLPSRKPTETNSSFFKQELQQRVNYNLSSRLIDLSGDVESNPGPEGARPGASVSESNVLVVSYNV